jgi:hypothetical protein
MGIVSVSRAYVPGLGSGSSTSYCPDCSRCYSAWVEGRTKRKLQGCTPYEELAARFQSESEHLEQESKKRTTATLTKERKALLSAIACDYRDLVKEILDSVLRDRESHLPDEIDSRIEKLRQKLSVDPKFITFPDERLANIQEAVKGLRLALPAHLAIRRRQTRVLM